MNFTDPLLKLANIGINGRMTSRGEIEVNCFYCGHSRAAVNARTGLYNCFRCGKGGSLSSVLRELNGTVPEVCHKPKAQKTPSGSRIDHKYYDEIGKHIFTVCRQYFTDGSKITPSYPAHGYTVEQKRDFMRRYIYNLPQVLDSIKFDGLIYIVEGEKCADALQKHVAPAAVTCNPCGAGKWTNAMSEWFRYVVPADVVIFPDNDTAGRDHAQMVAASLYRVDSRMQIRIVSLPNIGNKNDIADWIKNNG